MIGRVVVLDEVNGQAAAALIVDGELQELLVDPADDTPLPGAIYRAVADRPMKGQGGMFVKLPDGSGFLRQTNGVAPGQRVIVQVTGPCRTRQGAARHLSPAVQIAAGDCDAGCAGPEHLSPHQGRIAAGRAGGYGRRRHGRRG